MVEKTNEKYNIIVFKLFAAILDLLGSYVKGEICIVKWSLLDVITLLLI